MMDFKTKLERAEKLLATEESTSAARECVILIEQAFRENLKQSFLKLKEKDRIRLQKTEQSKGRGGVESFTMNNSTEYSLSRRFRAT